MNPDRVGRIPPPTRRLVVRKANSQRDLRPITERVRIHVVFTPFFERNMGSFHFQSCLLLDKFAD